MFQAYLDKGVVVIPERKGCPLKGIQWSKYYKQNEKPAPEQIKEWEKLKNIGYGLVTGKASNIIAIDIDLDDPFKCARIEKMLGETPCKKFGTKGMTLFYKYNNEPQKNYRQDEKTIVEIKADGGKVTIPPSEHYREKGVFYKWIGEDLIDCLDQLPRFLPIIMK
jgi:hypothetical protein